MTLQVAAKALETGMFGAYFNVLINLKDISDDKFKDQVSSRRSGPGPRRGLQVARRAVVCGHGQSLWQQALREVCAASCRWRGLAGGQLLSSLGGYFLSHHLRKDLGQSCQGTRKLQGLGPLYP